MDRANIAHVIIIASIQIDWGEIDYFIVEAWNEKPWIVHSKTGSVRDVEVEFISDPIRKIKIVVTNTVFYQKLV